MIPFLAQANKPNASRSIFKKQILPTTFYMICTQWSISIVKINVLLESFVTHSASCWLSAFSSLGLVGGFFQVRSLPKTQDHHCLLLLLKINFVFLKISYKQDHTLSFEIHPHFTEIVVEFHCWVWLGVATQTVYLPPVEEFQLFPLFGYCEYHYE